MLIAHKNSYLLIFQHQDFEFMAIHGRSWHFGPFWASVVIQCLLSHSGPVEPYCAFLAIFGIQTLLYLITKKGSLKLFEICALRLRVFLGGR